MKFIIAKKIGMSQVFAQDGTVIPVTVLQAGPLTVTQVKTVENDGYQAVQVGFGSKKAKHTTKPMQGHLKDLGLFSVIKEFRTTDTYERGQKLTVEQFTAGESVDATGVSIGRGFAGVVKRHGFHGSPATHGHKDQLRMPGSLASKRQGPVAKGKRMGGHMGVDRVTIKNLTVVEIDTANNILKVKGAVPGATGAIVTVKTSK
ncbi:MAG: 50S ribosomal protein L3 [Candidatus Kerfeldbacteria bacterium]|nr:50S ribosomal protein L3 [Candidatus Kerfeldbacteria bacterium]